MTQPRKSILDDAKNVARFYLSADKPSIEACALEFGCSTTTIRRALQKAKVRPRPIGRAPGYTMKPVLCTSN